MKVTELRFAINRWVYLGLVLIICGFGVDLVYSFAAGDTVKATPGSTLRCRDAHTTVGSNILREIPDGTIGVIQAHAENGTVQDTYTWWYIRWSDDGTTGWSVQHDGTNWMLVVLPAITSLNPTSGSVGTSVTITGKNFGSTQGTVAFTTAVNATVTSWTDTSIVCTVPNGAATGNVTVSITNWASNGVSFTVTAVSDPTSPVYVANSFQSLKVDNSTWIDENGTNDKSSPDCRVQVQDTGLGLDVSNAAY